MYSLNEVAQIMGISVRTLHRMKEKREIPFRRFGTAIRIPAIWVEKVCSISEEEEKMKIS